MDTSVNPAVQANLRTYTIPAKPDGALTGLLNNMRQGVAPDWDFYAYWSSNILDYVIEKSDNRYLGNPPSMCNAPPGGNHFAFTQDNMLKDVITICPDSFLPVSEPYETIAIAMADPASTAIGTPLNNVSPRGLTLLHELVHLTLGTDIKKTGDSGSKRPSRPRLV
jgi:hypothetical protein